MALAFRHRGPWATYPWGAVVVGVGVVTLTLLFLLFCCRNAIVSFACVWSASHERQVLGQITAPHVHGLHFHDVDQLLKVIHRLRDHGNTIVVIEHNLDVIKTADWVIDLGPEGGNKGGKIIATGTPETVSENPKSFTGHYLKPLLNK